MLSLALYINSSFSLQYLPARDIYNRMTTSVTYSRLEPENMSGPVESPIPKSLALHKQKTSSPKYNDDNYFVNLCWRVEKMARFSKQNKTKKVVF